MQNSLNPDEISYPIMESFYTLQGEGFHQGKAAYFIRLGGCDVGCHWCDVKDSWDAEKHPKINLTSIQELLSKESKTNLVVITGGEPLMYDMLPLTNNLVSNGYKTHIETSGAYEVTGNWDWFCLSPKKFKAPHESAFVAADELKIIVFNSSDFDFALQSAQKVNPNCHLFLQPEWSKKELMMPIIIDFVKQNPKWRITLQTHKYMDIP